MDTIKIISGGQTGVDQAALRAAKRLGIPTGGTMPRGWLTEDGPRPDFAELYGMVECEAEGYPARTARNVRDSDVTLWYGPIGSRGYQATLKAARSRQRPFVHIDDEFPEDVIAEIRQQVGIWPSVVNCAGNRESSNPGVGAKAEAFWLELFAALRAELEKAKA
jgi:hypothetical protein